MFVLFQTIPLPKAITFIAVSETVEKTESKVIHRNPSIPEMLAMSAAKFAAPAIPRVPSVSVIQESEAIHSSGENLGSHQSSDEGFTLFCMLIFLPCMIVCIESFDQSLF